MAVYALWFGGSGYAPSDPTTDGEVFPDVEAAKQALIDRERHGYWMQQDFAYVAKPAESVLCPAVEQSFMDLYFSEEPPPAGDMSGWDSPDLRIHVGTGDGNDDDTTFVHDGDWSDCELCQSDS